MGTLWWAELVQWLPPVLGDHFISEYVARVADIVIDYALHHWPSQLGGERLGVIEDGSFAVLAPYLAVRVGAAVSALPLRNGEIPLTVHDDIVVPINQPAKISATSEADDR